MSSSSSSSSPSSPSSTRRWKHDVFLNFYGNDTRRGFTRHLYDALKRNSINAYMDDEKLKRGKLIAPELAKAIQESKYAVVVLSRNYTLSRWCLFELATIVDCMKMKMIKVLPIFYDVEPSQVRRQIDNFAKAFARYELNPDIKREDIQTWKAALCVVGNIAGWTLQDRYETAIIEEVLATIQGELHNSSKLSRVRKEQAVGIEFHAENFSKLKDIESDDHDVGCTENCYGLQKAVLMLDIHDDRDKRNAIKTVSFFAGIDFIGIDMKAKKLTVMGTMDPIHIVRKLRRYWRADIISIGPAKVLEKKEKPGWKKEEANKEDQKKRGVIKKDEKKREEEEEEKILEIVNGKKAYNPYRTSHNYHVQTHSKEEKPKEKEEKEKEKRERDIHEEYVKAYAAFYPYDSNLTTYYYPYNPNLTPYYHPYNPNLTQYYYVQSEKQSNPNSCAIC